MERRKRMLSKFTDSEVKEFLRAVDTLRVTYPTLDDYLLLEIFLTLNRDALNRREPNSARKVAELVMARWRKEQDLKDALKHNTPSD
jgi:hypothetical protein